MDRRAFLRTTALHPWPPPSPGPHVWAGSTAGQPVARVRGHHSRGDPEPLGRDPRLGAPAPGRGHRLPQDPRAHLERQCRESASSPDPRYGAGSSSRSGPPEPAPVLEVVSRIATRDRHVDLTLRAAPRRRIRGAPAVPRAHDLIRTDGIVEATAREITQTAGTDMEKARALYEWIVENTFRDPKVRGCGLGDIQTMLETKNLGGKCADLNALFVGFARLAWASPLATSTASGSPTRPTSRAWVGAATSRRPSTAAPSSTAPAGAGSGGPGRRAQGRARGKGGRPAARRTPGREGPRQAVRRLGDELDGVQLRPRCEAPGSDTAGVPHVSAGRDRRRGATAWTRTSSATRSNGARSPSRVGPPTFECRRPGSRRPGRVALRPSSGPPRTLRDREDVVRDASRPSAKSSNRRVRMLRKT